MLNDRPQPPAGLFNDQAKKRPNLSCLSDVNSATAIPRLATIASPTDLPQLKKKLSQSSMDSSEKVAMPKFYKSDLMPILEERNRWKEKASSLEDELEEWKRFFLALKLRGHCTMAIANPILKA